MGQYWKLLNIDKRQEILHGAFKLEDFLADLSAEQLVGLLRPPKWVPFKIPSEKLQASKAKWMDCPLIALPQEIIDLFISTLADIGTGEDLVCLSLTSSYFFRLLASRLQGMLEVDAAPWVGDRLIFVGDYACGVPRDLGTLEERLKWEEMGDNPLYDLCDRAFVSDGIPKALPIWVKIDQIKCSFAMDLYALERMEADNPEDEDTEDIDLSGRLMDMLKVDLPVTEPRVLRNLTAKEYVNDEVLGKSKYAYSVGEVVLLNTIWTEDPSGTGDLGCEGAWAGHRFDIANLSDVAGDGWTDVTKNAIRRLEIGTEWPKKDGRRA